MSNKPRALTLREVEVEDSSSLWVLNKTDPRGVLNVSMPDGLGGTIIMSIPVTWIPIDLTTQATKENLLKSPVFRRLVTMGALSIISEESASKIMAEPDARKEAGRVYSMLQPAELSTADAPEIAKMQEEASGKISGFAMNIVTMGLEEDNMLTMIRGQDGVLTKDDYKYISENSSHLKVKEYCAEAALGA